MLSVLLIVHLLIAIGMVGIILLQRSEGGALGIGGNPGGIMSGRAAGNFLTRGTAILAVLFFATSLGLAILANQQSKPTSILDQIPPSENGKAPAAPSEPAAPAAPAAPISR